MLQDGGAPAPAGYVPSKVSNEELVAERRAQLVASATELFLRKGYHQTSIREIAAAAGWQMGTLYLYISSKQDVLFLITQAIVERVSAGFGAVRSGSPRDQLVDLVDYHIRAVDRMRREIQLLYRESASLGPEHLDIVKQVGLSERHVVAEIIQRGVDCGEFRPVNSHLVANNIMMLGDMWALKGWVLRRHLDLEAYVEQQTDLLLFQLGISTPTRALR
ncbi:MAG: TetR/AcrR family transcriptional regulator [Dehalococcoidia bacterium]